MTNDLSLYTIILFLLSRLIQAKVTKVARVVHAIQFKSTSLQEKGLEVCRTACWKSYAIQNN